MSIQEFLKNNTDDYEKQMTLIANTLRLNRFNDDLIKKSKKVLALGRGNADAKGVIVLPNLKPEYIYILERIMENVKKVDLSEFYITPFWKFDSKEHKETFAKTIAKEVEIIDPNLIIIVNNKMGDELSPYLNSKPTMVLPDFELLLELERKNKKNPSDEYKEETIKIQKDMLKNLKGFNKLYNKDKIYKEEQ